MIAFCDETARFRRDRQTIKAIVYEMGVQDRFILKEQVAAFEAQVKSRLGARDAIGVSGSTGGLTVALAALNVGRGDEVITPALSSPASANAILARGAIPVFVDVNEVTATIDPGSIERSLTRRSRAVLAVHAFCLADMVAIKRVASARGLGCVEEAGGFFGATIAGRPAGRWGDVGVLSFSAAQPLGGIAEAGMVVTDDDVLATACRMLRNHGQDGVNRFHHHLVGYNSRMDELAAAYLSHRLRSYGEEARRRAEIVAHYNERLKALAERVTLPPDASPEWAYPKYVIQADRRDELEAFLGGRGIETRTYARKPLPQQPVFAQFGHAADDVPNARRLCRRILALPLYAEMSDDHVDQVADAVLAYYDGTEANHAE